MAHSISSTIDPPLLNSASPWATTFEDIKALYECPFTGAATVRTSLLKGFQHDDTVHQYVFFESRSAARGKGEDSIGAGRTSLNTLGYNPVTLEEYLQIVGIATQSVTGTLDDVKDAYFMVNSEIKAKRLDLWMEINLSCPNIKSKPPPGYDGAALAEYLVLLQAQMLDFPPVGIKLLPYTYMGQFEEVVGAIASATVDGRSVVDFVTATNTLGSSLNGDCQPALASEAGTGLGGLVGAALHSLALGNVATLRRILGRR